MTDTHFYHKIMRWYGPSLELGMIKTHGVTLKFDKVLMTVADRMEIMYADGEWMVKVNDYPVSRLTVDGSLVWAQTVDLTRNRAKRIPRPSMTRLERVKLGVVLRISVPAEDVRR